ncbi:collagen alpha-1(I) chain-like [Chroicocephalus ridibundus]|uniref:collagen alpha-1(I) chain-like n=1 Tax=Chroicocephalus ridibundus TaxID=1192867 RepID=UPI002FDD7972
MAVKKGGVRPAREAWNGREPPRRGGCGEASSLRRVRGARHGAGPPALRGVPGAGRAWGRGCCRRREGSWSPAAAWSPPRSRADGRPSPLAPIPCSGKAAPDPAIAARAVAEAGGVAMGTGPGGSRYRGKRVNTSGARRQGRAIAAELPPPQPRRCAPERETLRGAPGARNPEGSPGEQEDECEEWLLLQPQPTASLKIRWC